MTQHSGRTTDIERSPAAVFRRTDFGRITDRTTQHRLPATQNTDYLHHRSKEYMTNLLGLLRALQIHYHMLHWQAHGPNFAGDHAMYKGIYKSVSKEIDTWAEKIVYLIGPNAVGDVYIVSIIGQWIDRWSKLKTEAEIALVPELDFQSLAKSVIEELRQSGKLTLGVDDFLVSACNSHETNLYQLKQRFDLQKV